MWRVLEAQGSQTLRPGKGPQGLDLIRAPNVLGNLNLPLGEQEGSDVWLLEQRYPGPGVPHFLGCTENARALQFAIPGTWRLLRVSIFYEAQLTGYPF